MIGGDSYVGDGDQIKTVRRAKVFALNEDMIVGCAGWWRAIQLMRHKFIAPPHEYGDTDEYMVSCFTDALRHFFASEGFGELRVEDVVESPVNMLVGYGGRLYEIGNVFDADRVDDYAAVGSGSAYALGALHVLGSTSYATRDKLELALKAAERHSSSVRGPFDFLEL